MDQIHLLTDCTNELRAMIDTNRNTAEALTRTVDVSKEELQAAAQLVSEAADALTVPAPDQTHSQRSIPLPRASYAEIVRQSPHTIAVAHCDSQARTICLTHPLTAPDSDVSLNNLSEDVLVKKANLAIELAQKEDDGTLPPGAKFLSVRKTTHGSLLYEVDSEETVTWLRSTKGQQAFAAKFGTEVSLASKPFSVIMEYVPVRLAIDDPNTLREMERENDLPVNTIRSI